MGILASLVQTETQCQLKVPSKLKRQSHNDQQNVAESTAVVATGIHAQTVQVTLVHFIAEVTAHGMELQVSVAKQPHSDQRLKHLSHSDQQPKHQSRNDPLKEQDAMKAAKEKLRTANWAAEATHVSNLRVIAVMTTFSECSRMTALILAPMYVETIAQVAQAL